MNLGDGKGGSGKFDLVGRISKTIWQHELVFYFSSLNPCPGQDGVAGAGVVVHLVGCRRWTWTLIATRVDRRDLEKPAMGTYTLETVTHETADLNGYMHEPRTVHSTYVLLICYLLHVWAGGCGSKRPIDDSPVACERHQQRVVQANNREQASRGEMRAPKLALANEGSWLASFVQKKMAAGANPGHEGKGTCWMIVDWLFQLWSDLRHSAEAARTNERPLF